MILYSSLKFLPQSNRRWPVFEYMYYPYARVFLRHCSLQPWDQGNRITGWFRNRVAGSDPAVFERRVESRFVVPRRGSAGASGVVCCRAAKRNRRSEAWSESILGFGFYRLRQRRCASTRVGSWCYMSILWRLYSFCRRSWNICVWPSFDGCRCLFVRGRPHLDKILWS